MTKYVVLYQDSIGWLEESFCSLENACFFAQDLGEGKQFFSIERVESV